MHQPCQSKFELKQVLWGKQHGDWHKSALQLEELMFFRPFLRLSAISKISCPPVTISIQNENQKKTKNKRGLTELFSDSALRQPLQMHARWDSCNKPNGQASSQETTQLGNDKCIPQFTCLSGNNSDMSSTEMGLWITKQDLTVN